MKSSITSFLIIVMFIGCKSRPQKRLFQNYLVASEWVLDTIPNGRTIFYDAEGNVISNQYYVIGKKEGFSIFYKNGYTDSVHYYNDLREGFSFQIDSENKLISKLFFIKNRQIGPQFHYTEGKLSTYEFLTYEKRSPFISFYDLAKNEIKIQGKPYYVSVNEELIEGKIVFFAYLAYPPYIQIEYNLVEKVTDSSYKDLRAYKEGDYIVDTSLIKSKYKKYYLKTYINDTINNFSHIYMTELNNE